MTKGASSNLCKCSQHGPGPGLTCVLFQAVDPGCISETWVLYCSWEGRVGLTEEEGREGGGCVPDSQGQMLSWFTQHAATAGSGKCPSTW